MATDGQGKERQEEHAMSPGIENLAPVFQASSAVSVSQRISPRTLFGGALSS